MASIDVEAEISFDDPSLCSAYCSFCQEVRGKHKCHLKGVLGVPVDVNAPEILERIQDQNDPDPEKVGLKRTAFCLKFFNALRIKEDEKRKRKSAGRKQSGKKTGRRKRA